MERRAFRVGSSYNVSTRFKRLCEGGSSTRNKERKYRQTVDLNSFIFARYFSCELCQLPDCGASKESNVPASSTSLRGKKRTLCLLDKAVVHIRISSSPRPEGVKVWIF